MKTKVLPITNLQVIEEMVYMFLERNDKLEHAEHTAVMANIESGMKRGDSFVLVDDVNDPTCFYWGWYVSTPHIVTNMKELISMAAWDESEGLVNMEDLIKGAQMKARMSKHTDFFMSSAYPFSEVLDDSYEAFETAHYKKL